MKRFKSRKIQKKEILIIVILISIPIIFITAKLFASTSFTWDFSTPSDYTLSDSNKIQVTGGEASLKQVQTNITDNSQSEFDLGTYSNTLYSSGNLTLGNTSQHITAPDSGLVGFWKLDDGSGTTASDSSGLGHNGTLVGSPTWTTGKVGNALSFSGTNYVTIPEYSQIEFGDYDRSYGGWIKTTITTQGIPISKHLAGSPNGSFITTNYPTANKVSCYAPDAYSTSTSTITDGNWHYVICTFNAATNTQKLYFDGNLEDTDVISNGVTNNAPFAIGSLSGAHGTAGSADEVIVYNTVLTDTQIKENYLKNVGHYGEYSSKVFNTSITDGVTWQNVNWVPNSPYGKELPNNAAAETQYSEDNVDMSGNIGLWHFNGNWNDSSGQNNTASPSGNSTPSSTAKFGSNGAYFDGSGDYITLGNTGFNVNTGTLSVWLKPSFNSSSPPTTYNPIFQWGTTTSGIQLSYSVASGFYSYINLNYRAITGPIAFAANTWIHVAIDWDFNNDVYNIYENGTKLGTNTTALTAPAIQTMSLGGGNSQYWTGGMDELAIFNHVLTNSEVGSLYKRGINDVKYQVRSCDDNACSGESFIGPDGTSNTYYSDANNTSTDLPTFALSNVSNNQYFQYKTILETDNSSYLPKISSNTFTYQNYPVDKPSVSSTNSLDLTSRPQSIDHFCEGTLDGSSNCTTTSTKPAGSEIYYQICGDTVSNCDSNNTWKYWDGAAWSNASSSANSNIASDINTNISSFSPSSKYFAFKSFLSSSGQNTPVLTDVSLDLTYDTTLPTQNATSINISGVNDGDWIKSKPQINWTEGNDNVGGSGLLGYCISLDESTPGNSNSVNPATSGGILHGLDDGVTESYCDYIATGDHVDLSSISGLTLTTGKQYYFSIKAVDVTGNIWSGASNLYQDLISFKFDNTPPENPDFISMPSNFISTKDATITWPTTGGNEATDVGAGLAGLQYKIGSVEVHGMEIYIMVIKI